MKLLAAVLLVSATGAAADTARTTRRTVTDLAEGVFTIRHPDAPDDFPQGNTTVIVGSRAALVVDACYLPSSAREDIAEIQRRVRVPVRWLVNTHWHYDHTMGNGEYAATFPGLSVVAHRETARNAAGYNPRWFERYPTLTREQRDALASGKGTDGKDLTDAQKDEVRKAVAARELVEKEFAAIRDRTPDVAFDREMEIDLGGRVVRLLHLGRGNTAGDVAVHLPAERILVAGDLLTHPVPYLGGGYPVEHAATLRRLGELDFATIVPGHGEVLRDRVHLDRVVAFVEGLLRVMSDEIYRSGRRGDFDTVKTAVEKSFDVAPWRKAFAGEYPGNLEYFDGFAWPGLLKAAHAELWRR